MSKIKVGLDFDGVIAYNPLRVARRPVTLLKRIFLGGHDSETQFFIPRTYFQKWLWKLFHNTSFLLAPGLEILREHVNKGEIEVYLISGRYGYLEGHLRNFLEKKKIKDVFKEIYVNKENKQPHEYKKTMIETLGLDAYVEDNWDIVEFLNRNNNKAKVYWITNIFDRFVRYPHKYYSLKSVIEIIISSTPHSS